MPRKPTSRVPSAVGSIPVLGDLARSADQQARWMQELLEQNARLVGQLPATLKSFNDALERFNQTVGRLDAAVSRIETVSRTLTGPLDRISSVSSVAIDTQRQVVVLQGTIERIVTVLADLPGAGILRRRSADPTTA